MSNNTSRSDKMFDIILEEAVNKYANDVSYLEVECEMTEEEIRTMEAKEKIIYNKLMKGINTNKNSRLSIKKICILVAILLIGIIGITMCTSAVKNLVNRSKITMSGTDIKITTERLFFGDYDTIENFQEKSKILIPNWLPEGMKIDKITDYSNLLAVQYRNESNFITITTDYDFGVSTQKIATENNEYSIKETEVLGMKCTAVTVTSEIGLTAHSAYWSSENTSYSLITNLSEEEFYKILKNLVYFEE